MVLQGWLLQEDTRGSKMHPLLARGESVSDVARTMYMITCLRKDLKIWKRGVRKHEKNNSTQGGNASGTRAETAL